MHPLWLYFVNNCDWPISFLNLQLRSLIERDSTSEVEYRVSGVTTILETIFNLETTTVNLMRLCQPPDGNTSPKYKLLCFITTKTFLQR